MSDQCLYIIGTPSGYYKIGIAADPSTRLRELQTGNPEHLAVYAAFEVGELRPRGISPRDFERTLHEMLRPFRVKGEWFKAPIETISRAYKIAVIKSALPPVFERWMRLCHRPTYVAAFLPSSLKRDAEIRSNYERIGHWGFH